MNTHNSPSLFKLEFCSFFYMQHMKNWNYSYAEGKPISNVIRANIASLYLLFLCAQKNDMSISTLVSYISSIYSQLSTPLMCFNSHNIFITDFRINILIYLLTFSLYSYMHVLCHSIHSQYVTTAIAKIVLYCYPLLREEACKNDN